MKRVKDPKYGLETESAFNWTCLSAKSSRGAPNAKNRPNVMAHSS